MTIREVSKQICRLSDGRINGEKFSQTEFTNYLKGMFRTGTSVIVSLELPDGHWLCEVDLYEFHPYCAYDYFLPENREQEKILYRRLNSKNQLKGGNN